MYRTARSNALQSAPGCITLELLVCCRNIRQYPEASQEAGLLLVRLDAPLYFANVQYVRDRLRKYELRSQVGSGIGFWAGGDLSALSLLCCTAPAADVFTRHPAG
jgi:MFS superfamily sulfate permease-like transporter